MSFLAVSLVALVFSFVGSLPLVGPIAVLVVSNGVNGRYKDALQIGLGAAVAEGIYAFLAFWGFATFLARYAIVLPISRAVTAAVLLSLGVHFLFFRLKDVAPTSARQAKRGRFWVGFSISILNPTLLATWSAVTTFLYSKQLVAMTALLAIPFGGFAAGGIMLWAFMMVALMRTFRERFPKGLLTWIVRGMGVVLIGVGLWSGAELVRYIVAKAPAGHVAADAASPTTAGDGVLEARSLAIRREHSG
jgi:threonine/homoserine/homoserine lactone efflux protein